MRAEEAIARARERLSLDPTTAASAWRARREDLPGESYYLVVLGDRGRARAVAAVDAARGEVMEWADLPGSGPHLTVDADEARVRAGVAADAEAELMWRPCRASRSLLHPIWRVVASDRVIYVDQQGVVWESLEAPGPGG